MSVNPVFLIFGANGWIGSKVNNLLVTSNKQITVYKAQSRADDIVAVEKELDCLPTAVTHVMSFIGRTHGTYEGQTISTTDYLEKPGKLVEKAIKSIINIIKEEN